MIRAGTVDEAIRYSGDWVFVDLGFAEKAKSCGLLIGDGEPEEITFSQLKARLLDLLAFNERPLNLLIEAPLSVAFNERGNPTGRAIEKRDRQHRYWYVGLGCAVMVAATYMLRDISASRQGREIRLFEGLASFKTKAACSSHRDDVINLRRVIWEGNTGSGYIVPAEKLAVSATHQLISAFLVAGMDFGVPPVIVLSDHQIEHR